MGLSDKNYVALFQVSGMSEERHSRDLIFAINCCRILTLMA